MKKTFESAISFTLKMLIVLAMLLGLNCKAVPNYLLNGSFTTNFNAAYNAGTNSSGVNTNNYYIGTVSALTNVFFYLSSSSGSLPSMPTNFLASGTNAAPGTNSWPPYLPTLEFSPQGGYPNTLYGPSRIVWVGYQPNLMTTNVGISSSTAVFAGSGDGIWWNTNIFSITATIPINSLTATNALASTNYDSGAWPYVALWGIFNSTNTVNLTNIVIPYNMKPGI